MLPLVRAFRIMADERTIDARQKALYEAILGELRKGVPLSDAMESCAPAFPNLLLAMIRSAEGTGSIDHACMRMATYYEREHKMNQQVGNSLMYPLSCPCSSSALLRFDDICAAAVQADV